jgi:hypothetical protein
METVNDGHREKYVIESAAPDTNRDLEAWTSPNGKYVVLVVSTLEGERLQITVHRSELAALAEALVSNRKLVRVQEALDKLARRSYEMSMAGGEMDLGKDYSSGHYTGMLKGIDEARHAIEDALVDLAALPQDPGSGVKAVLKAWRKPAEPTEFRRTSGGTWVGGGHAPMSDDIFLRYWDVTEVL